MVTSFQKSTEILAKALKLVEAMGQNQVHMSFLLKMAKEKSEDENHTLLVAANHFADVTFESWQELEQLLRDDGAKGGA